jgi:predicted acyl esterase
MTTRLTIKNDDASRSATTTLIDVGPDGARMSEGKAEAPVTLAPGESREVWIHKGRVVLVEELDECSAT